MSCLKHKKKSKDNTADKLAITPSPRTPTSGFGQSTSIPATTSSSNITSSFSFDTTYTPGTAIFDPCGNKDPFWVG